MTRSAITKAAADVTGHDDGGNGAFDIVLSAQTRDRDGDVLHADGWKTPLPDHIPIGVDHGMNVATTVGSGTPFINSAGDLQVRGTFASTDLGQQVRTLVNEGHMRTVSVEFLTDRSAKSAAGQRELVGGAFVYLPSNREARVLSSKATAAVDRFAATAKSTPANSLDADAVGQLVDLAEQLPTLDDDNAQGALVSIAALCGQLTPGADDIVAADDSGAEDGANKAAAVSARVKAMLLALGQ